MIKVKNGWPKIAAVLKITIVKLAHSMVPLFLRSLWANFFLLPLGNTHIIFMLKASIFFFECHKLLSVKIPNLLSILREKSTNFDCNLIQMQLE